jgi:hypothetical protein
MRRIFMLPLLSLVSGIALRANQDTLRNLIRPLDKGERGIRRTKHRAQTLAFPPFWINPPVPPLSRGANAQECTFYKVCNKVCKGSFAIIALILLGLSAPAPSAHAQLFSQSPDTTAIRFGISGRWLLNRHAAAFDTLRGVNSCLCEAKTVYGNAVSNGWDLGLLAELPFARLGDVATTSIAARVLYSSGVGANLTALERKNNNMVLIEHTLNVNLSTIAVEALASVRLWKRFSVYAGAQGALLAERKYAIREQILEPNDITYASGQRTYNAASGELPFVNPLQVSLVSGIAFEVPVNRQGTILPTLEAFYTYGLTSPVPGADWRISSFRAGLSLRFSPYRTTELTGQEVEERYQDSLRQAKDATERALAEAKESRKKELGAKIGELRPVFFNDDFNDDEAATTDTNAQNRGAQLTTKFTVDNFMLRVQQTSVQQHAPLVAAVFFGAQSSVLPSRYKVFSSAAETAKFSMTALSGLTAQANHSTTLATVSATLAAYYHLLNVVGKRLQEFLEATLTITGTAVESEPGTQRLAESRAAVVAGYLENVWRVPASRLNVKTRIEAVSPNALENEQRRRVELESNVEKLLAPVVTTLERRTVTPPGLEFGLQITAGQGLKQWELEITQLTNRESLTLVAAKGGKTYPKRYLWDVRRSPPVSSDDVSVRLTIDDANNNKFEAPIISVNVQEEARKGRSEVYALWEKASITPALAKLVQLPQQERLFAEAVQKRVPADAANVTVRIPVLLAGREAFALPNSTRRPLLTPLFDPSTPEGNIYNRAAIIEFQQP